MEILRPKSEEKYRAELARLDGMLDFERKYDEYGFIAGLDEAGRGPLAGPVVAASVILPKDDRRLLPYLNDSKKVSEKRRAVLFDEIKEVAIAYGIGIIKHERIDEINILQADYEAMRIAIDAMSVRPDMLFCDAVHIPDIDIKQIAIVHGDAASLSIAAASILAKVTRDRMMEEYDRLYPEYGFAKHKGYGTAAHIAALKQYGPCPIHRKSFIGNFI